jgi:hypothetical protein
VSAETAIAAGQAAAEARMVDTCTITRAGAGPREFNRTNGQTVAPARTVIYSGKCKIQARVESVASISEGGQLVIVRNPELQLPISATSVDVDDVAHVDAVGPWSDAALVDREFRIAGDPAKTFATARRLPCEEVIHG